MCVDIGGQEKILRQRLDYYSKIHNFRSEAYVLHKHTNIIPRLKRALAKIREGTYGECDDCGEQIAAGRLKLIPGAILCIECKTEEEQQRG